MALEFKSYVSNSRSILEVSGRKVVAALPGTSPSFTDGVSFSMR